ncbi:spermidine/putrescine transport system permease protein [Allopseudospirillum japonicum]|uniref:Spermidine/putrescine transport system permease protein PotC n=1 Tax=Allopseudospirillum japonicum TaxID=64971 RepID=A0A1H6Q172_9GAMM|nr:spermidine/putrescine ABC transporter permease PotC [Allopseudospirillum japonicum]SEI37593.1 spermidine/putrescine transport system permease protein [Allopseudospirillum japonicum]
MITWLTRGYMTLVYLFLYLPILVLIGYAFNDSRSLYTWGGLSLRWFEAALNNTLLMQATGHSLLLAIVAATGATIVGTLTAIALYRYRFRGKKLLNGLLFTVMMSPDIVMAISLLALFILLGIHLGFISLVLSHITFCIPFIVVTVYSRLSNFNPAILEAAKDLGCNEWQMTRHVLVPIILPAIAAGWLLGFTLSLDDVVVSTFVTGPTYEILPLRIYSMVRVGLKPEVNALATLMLLISLLALLASHLLIKKGSS